MAGIEGAAEGTRSFLTRKVAGIPIVAIIGVGAAVILYFVMRNRSATSAASSASSDTSTTDTGSADSGTPDSTDAIATDGNGSNEQPTFTVLGNAAVGGTTTGITNNSASGTSYSVSSNGAVTGQAAPQTNDQWGQIVQTWLAGQGVAATEASNIVQLYLGSGQMSAAQEKWINLAIAQYGYPPEGAPSYVAPTPAPTGVVTSSTGTGSGPTTLHQTGSKQPQQGKLGTLAKEAVDASNNAVAAAQATAVDVSNNNRAKALADQKKTHVADANAKKYAALTTGAQNKAAADAAVKRANNAVSRADNAVHKLGK